MKLFFFKEKQVDPLGASPPQAVKVDLNRLYKLLDSWKDYSIFYDDLKAALPPRPEPRKELLQILDDYKKGKTIYLDVDKLINLVNQLKVK